MQEEKNQLRCNEQNNSSKMKMKKKKKIETEKKEKKMENEEQIFTASTSVSAAAENLQYVGSFDSYMHKSIVVLFLFLVNAQSRYKISKEEIQCSHYSTFRIFEFSNFRFHSEY